MRILTPQRLVSISQSPHLRNSWFFIAAATLSVCNMPNEIPYLYHYALKVQAQQWPKSIATAEKSNEITNSLLQNADLLKLEDPASFALQQVVTSKMREALLKSVAIGGLPKAINSLMELKSVCPEPLLEHNQLRNTSIESNVIEEERERGNNLWRKVYNKISYRVQSQMESSYPDLWSYAINHVYAPLFSFADILNAKETSLVVVACLIPQDVNPQLKGHLKGALNNGCTREEVNEARQLIIDLATWSGVTWKEDIVSKF